MDVKKLETVARRVMAAHPERIAKLRQEMATNYTVSAQRLINSAFHDMGVNRFPGGVDDLWEMITDLQNDWDYQRPPARILARWMAS